jgi:hypothetical protein
MRKLLLSVLFLPITALAQTAVTIDKPVVCAETKFLMSEILESYDETPIWGSELEDSRVGLFVNSKSKTWTIVQWNNEVACILEAGKNYILRLPKDGI